MKTILLFLVLLFSHSSFAQDFAPFQSLLNRHLQVTETADGGLQTAFKYEDAKKHSKTKSEIEKQTELLSKFGIKSLDNKNKAVSFWINSYNFFMIKTIMEQGFEGNKLEIKSVKDLGSFFSPYAIFKKKINDIGGKKYSLDQIEKGTLLGTEFKKKGWKDARVHFAVNCASVGCPPLLKEVYQEKNLDKTLDRNIQKAFKTKRHLHLKGKSLYLTHLFKWYKKDFQEAEGSVKSFIKKYIQDASLKDQVDQSKDIEYIDYDWKLNKPQNFKQ